MESNQEAFTYSDPHQIVDVMSPGSAPFRGMAPDQHPAGLPPGFFQDAQNVRARDGSIRVRWGSAGYFTNPATPANLLFRGGAMIDGADPTAPDVEITALDDGGATRVYTRLISGSPTTQLASEGATGLYGDTRMATGRRVEIAVVKAPPTPGVAPFPRASAPFAILQNGVDAPRILAIEPGGLPSARLRRVERFRPPDPSRCSVRPVWLRFWNLTSELAQGSATHSNNSTGLVGSLSARPVGAQALAAAYRIAINNPAAGNETTISGIAFGPARVASNQLHILYDSTIVNPWSFLRIAARVGADPTWHVVYDPTTSPPPPMIPCGPLTAAAFDISLSPVPLAGAITSLRFTFVGQPAWTGPQTLHVFVFAYGGQVDGGGQWAVTYYNSGSLVESPSVVLNRAADGGLRVNALRWEGQGLREPQRAVLIPGASVSIPIPDIPGFSFDYEVVAPRLEHSIVPGVDYIALYHRPFGGVRWHYCLAVQTLVPVGGFWTTTSYNGRFTTPTPFPDMIACTPPDEFAEPVPIGLPMMSVSNRLVVGAVKPLPSGEASDIYLSDAGNPFRFRPVPNLDDPDSGAVVRMQHEQVVALGSVNGTILGIDPLIVFTNQAVYSVEGGDAINLSVARRLGPHGTISPWSVALAANSIYWLDQDRRVCRLGTSIEFPGDQRVSTLLEGIGDAGVGNVSGLVWNRCYYLAYPASSTPTHALVYDELANAWTGDNWEQMESHVGTPMACARWWARRIAGRTHIGFWNMRGDAIRHEVPNQVFNINVQSVRSPISVRLTSREFTSEGFWSKIEMDRIGIVCDAVSASEAASAGHGSGGVDYYTLVTQRLPRASSAPPGASFFLLGPSSANAIWRWDRDAADGVNCRAMAVQDVGIRAYFTGQMLGGKRIHSIVCKISEVGGGADTA